MKPDKNIFIFNLAKYFFFELKYINNKIKSIKNLLTL